MSAPRRNLTVEHLLYGLIAALGLGVRLFRLGASPLSDFEAAAALPAWQLSAGQTFVDLGPQPGYAVLTWLLFFLFGSSNFIARFWPALVGGILPFLPYLFRKRLGSIPALLMAVGLALDPGLIAAARIAGGPMMALAFAALALVLLIDSQKGGSLQFSLAGICLGLALLSGPSLWIGAAGFVLAAITLRAIMPPGRLDPEWGRARADGQPDPRRILLISGGITLLLAGTFFLRFPQGIGALGGGLVGFLLGWAQPSGVPPGRLIAALLGYQGLVLVFASLSAWRGWRRGQTVEKAAALAALSAVLLVMVYPGRQVADLAWALVPLWLLAAREIGRQEAVAGLDRVVSAGLAAVLLTLSASAWMNLARLSSLVAGVNTTPLFIWTVDQYTVNLLVILGAIILMGLSYTTIRMWDPAVARRGLVWGLSVMLVFGMLSGVWGVSLRDPVEQRELWFPEPLAGQADLLEKTLHELGEWTAGHDRGLEIALVYDQPSMRWALRDFAAVHSGLSSGGETLPAVVLAGEGEQDLRLASAYRGQDFVWSVRPAWELLGLDGWLRWWIFRQAPAQQDQVILWAQADMFLAGEEVVEIGEPEIDAEQPAFLDDGASEN